MELDGSRLSLAQIAAIAHNTSEQVSLAPSAREPIKTARDVVDRIVAGEAIFYGVNTGFGRLADVQIRREELRQLQLNLVRSHACGVGAPLSAAETRALMLLRANVLALGRSGIRAEVLDLLCAMLSRGVHPIIPEKGSVGASGDLAPLAHLALALIGEGEVEYRGERIDAASALQRVGLQPVELQAKEGLALLNGTQAMHAAGGLALHRAASLVRLADVSGAMSLEALKGTPAAFDAKIQDARPHPGQLAAAEHLRWLLRASEIRESHRLGDARVQDAYSLRCMPQVHGAVRGALAHCEEVLEIESGSATDNPLVFAETGEIISGGNFHGAPLALALDYAAIAVTDLMSISERRIDRLVNPDMNEGLPPFLAPEAGTHSGFMILHVAAVALLNEAKVLAHPASIDNLPTSGGREDHVSMGMTSALKLRTIVGNAERLFAIELLTAAEGLEFRRPLRGGIGVEAACDKLRALSPVVQQDRAMAGDIEMVAAAIRAGDFDSGYEAL